MKAVFLILVLVSHIIPSTQLWSATKIKGKVTDQGGQPVIAAVVQSKKPPSTMAPEYFPDVVTDANGNYEINLNIPANQTWTVWVRAYKPHSNMPSLAEEVTIDEGTTETRDLISRNGTYQIVHITRPMVDSATPRKMNNNGGVVGVRLIKNPISLYGFHWDLTTQVLTDLNPLQGGNTSRGEGSGDAGDFVSTDWDNNFKPWAMYHADLNNAAKLKTNVPGIANVTQSFAVASTHSSTCITGHIAGTNPGPQNVVKVVVWDGPTANPHDFTALHPNQLIQRAVNTDCDVVGYSTFGANNLEKGFLYDHSENTLEAIGPANDKSQARDINDLGVIVGRFETGGNVRAAVLRKNGQYLNLGTLMGHSYAWGVADSGIIGGFARNGAGKDRAVVWDSEESGFITDLNELLPVQSGWVLQRAYDVADNSAVVGYGEFGGAKKQGFYLIPPSH